MNKFNKPTFVDPQFRESKCKVFKLILQAIGQSETGATECNIFDFIHENHRFLCINDEDLKKIIKFSVKTGVAVGLLKKNPHSQKYCFTLTAKDSNPVEPCCSNLARHPEPSLDNCHYRKPTSTLYNLFRNQSCSSSKVQEKPPSKTKCCCSEQFMDIEQPCLIRKPKNARNNCCQCLNPQPTESHFVCCKQQSFSTSRPHCNCNICNQDPCS